MVSEFTYVVLIATAFRLVAGYFIVDLLLQNFSYRISTRLSIFASATVISIAVTIPTVCYQALKSAIANPVNTLKIE